MKRSSHKELLAYHRFIDGIVSALSSTAASRLRSEWRYPEPDRSSRHYRLRLGRSSPEERALISRAEQEQRDYNQMADSLSSAQRDWVARLLEEEFQAGAEALLQYLQESGCRIHVGGLQLPQQPYGTEMYWDYGARAEGRDWPPEPIL